MSNHAAVSDECRELEHMLSSMLSRVERRQSAAPAVAADGDINRILYAGLRDTMQLTKEFKAACEYGYSPQYRRHKLAALVGGMPRVVDMVHALEGEKHLSPLFDRMMNREYEELRTVVRQIRDTVAATARVKEPQPEPVKSPDSLTLAFSLMLLPATMALAFFSGFAGGLQEASQKPKEQPKPRPHLKLVHNN